MNPCHEGHYIVDSILQSITITNVVNEWVTGISVLALIYGQTQQHYWIFTLPVCILEWTLWDPYTYKNISMPESVQKFACKCVWNGGTWTTTACYTCWVSHGCLHVSSLWN